MRRDGRLLRLSLPLVLSAGLLAGCETLSTDGGMSRVRAVVSREIGAEPEKTTRPGTDAELPDRIRQALTKPLTADAAVQIALINNRGLQAEYNDLGIAEADFVEATLPPNPVVSVGRMAASGFVEVERRLAADLLAIVTLPARREVARGEFEAARQRAIEATFQAAADTRGTYYRAVADRQVLGLLERALVSAQAAAELTKQLAGTGGGTKLDRARAEAFRAEILNRLVAARVAATSSREALTRQLGLPSPNMFSLPGALPPLPRLQNLKAVEDDALRRRVDLIAARLELNAMAKSLGIARATRFVSMLDGSVVATNSTEAKDTVLSKGFELDIAIPVFDLGGASARRAQEAYMRALNRLLEKTIAVRSEARAAYDAYRGSHEIAKRFEDQILPLRKTVNEEALLQYNGMIIDVFELLTIARESVESNIAAAIARRDFFLSAVDFQTALIGGGAMGAVADGQPSKVAARDGGH